MAMDEAALLAEANRINYRLRSTFFYRKLKEYNTLNFPSMIAQLFRVEHLYNWDDRGQWGIGEDAYGYINGHADLHLFQVFCHPKLLREHSQLVAYYRNVAALSQKAVSYLVGVDVKRYETDIENRFPLSADRAVALARLFNEHITLIVDTSIQTLTKNELYGILLTSTGAQIDGSWRNAIGIEAEKVVQRLIVKEAVARGMIAALIPRLGHAVELFNAAEVEDQVGNIEQFRGILLTNQTSILFSSDPDVSLLNAAGETVAAMEVKGGADPAGALERYGAAGKSFAEARRTAPGVTTILVASCITPEVHTRIRHDTAISSYYNLTEILSEGAAAYEQFMDEVFTLLGAID